MLTIDKTTPTPKPTLPVTRQPKLLDLMREAIRVRHYALTTERNYLQWARRRQPAG